MSRCAICDRTEGFTKSFAVTKSYSPVRWRAKFSEYQCDECYNSVRDSQLHWDQPEYEEGEVENLDEDLEDSEGTSTLY